MAKVYKNIFYNEKNRQNKSPVLFFTFIAIHTIAKQSFIFIFLI